MKKYFISKGTQKKGPYSIEEISSMQLTENYLIWKEGFEDWKKVTEVEELKSHVVLMPPPTAEELNRNATKKSVFNATIISLICFAIFWFIIYVFMVGDLNDYKLEERYGYESSFGMYGNGERIRESLIWISCTISGVVSLLIFLIAYQSNSDKKTT